MIQIGKPVRMVISEPLKVPVPEPQRDRDNEPVAEPRPEPRWNQSRPFGEPNSYFGCMPLDGLSKFGCASEK